eukprot:Mrub_03997.p1 GENE.Mrub_03997~~Mrub_03997.p1  ORF type:complete len:216 (-),score=26.20 Mrub_03997:523-1170(-)
MKDILKYLSKGGLTIDEFIFSEVSSKFQEKYPTDTKDKNYQAKLDNTIYYPKQNAEELMKKYLAGDSKEEIKEHILALDDKRTKKKKFLKGYDELKGNKDGTYFANDKEGFNKLLKFGCGYYIIYSENGNPLSILNGKGVKGADKYCIKKGDKPELLREDKDRLSYKGQYKTTDEIEQLQKMRKRYRTLVSVIYKMSCSIAMKSPMNLCLIYIHF